MLRIAQPFGWLAAVVLDVNKQRPVIRRERDAGDFAATRAGQEAAKLVGTGDRRHHLVVAHAFVIFTVDG